MASRSGSATRRFWGYNCDTLEGADYALDPTRPEEAACSTSGVAGRDLRDEEMFTVALNSYRAAGSSGYAVWRKCRRVSDSSKGCAIC